MAMAPEPANSPFGWYDRRVTDGDVPENIRSIAGWKRAIREFMSKDAKLNDVVMLFTQKFVQMGQSKNFTLSTIMDLAWTVLIITWEAVVDQKLPRSGAEEQGYKLRYEELKHQLFKIREEFLKEITQARDERRKRQGHGLQVAFNEIGEMGDQDVFHFMPEEGLDPQTREYFKAAMQENLKMALARGAAASEEEVARIAKALSAKDEECRGLKGDIEVLNERIEELEIELQDAVAVKPPPAPIRRSTSNNIKREVSKPTHSPEEIAAMLKQLEAAKQEEARLMEQVSAFREALSILGVDVADGLSRQQLAHLAKEKLMRSSVRGSMDTENDARPSNVHPRTSASSTKPVHQPPPAPHVDAAALKAAEAEVHTLKQQQTEHEAARQTLKGQVTSLERELEKLRKEMEVQKEQTVIAQREASRNQSLLQAKIAEHAQESSRKQKGKKDSPDTGGSEAKSSSSSSEKPQKPEKHKKTGLPPPASAPAVDVNAMEKLEAKCKSLEQQVNTLQTELKVERAAVAAAQAELKSQPPPPPPPPPAPEPRPKAQAAAPPAAAPAVVATTPPPPAVVEEPKPKVVVETRIVEVPVQRVEEPPPPTSAPVMGKLSANGSVSAEQKKLQKELQMAQEQMKSLEQAAIKAQTRTSLVEVEFEKSQALEQQLREEIQELKGQLQESKLMKTVIEQAMNDLTEKFNEMRAKLEEKGIDVSVFDSAVAETGIKTMINAGTLVFDRLYRDAVERRKGQRPLKRHKGGGDVSRNNTKKVLRPHVTDLSPVGLPHDPEAREYASSEDSSGTPFGFDSEEADGDAAAGGDATIGRRRRKRWICPNCGWASQTVRSGTSSGARTASPSRNLSKQSGPHSSGSPSPVQGRSWESAAEYDLQQHDWSDRHSPKDHSGAAHAKGGGFLPSFQPFPERSPSRRRPQAAGGGGGALPGGALPGGALPGGAATSPGGALTASSGNLTPITGRVALAATGGRSPLILPEGAPATREEVLALIFGGRDPSGLSIVSSGRGGANADPNEASDLRRVATQPWNAKYAKDTKEAKEPLPTRQVHTPSERIYVQSGGQQLLMSQPQVGVEPPSELHPLQVRALSPDSALRSTTFEFPGQDLPKTSGFPRAFTTSLPPRRASREREPRQLSVPHTAEVLLPVAPPDEAGGPTPRSPTRSLTPGARRRYTLPATPTRKLPYGEALPSISAGILHQDNLVFVGSPKQSAKQQLLAQLASAQLTPAHSADSPLDRRHMLVDPLASSQPQLSTVQLGETPQDFRRPMRSRLLEHLADTRLGSTAPPGSIKPGSLSPPHPQYLAPLTLASPDGLPGDPQSPSRGRAYVRMLRPETAPSLGSPERSLRRQNGEPLGFGVSTGLSVTGSFNGTNPRPWQQLVADGGGEPLGLTLNSRLDQTSTTQLQLGTAQLGNIERANTPPTYCSPLAPLLTTQSDATKRDAQSQKGRIAHSRMLRSDTAPSLGGVPITPEKFDRLRRPSRAGLRSNQGQDFMVTGMKNRLL